MAKRTKVTGNSLRHAFREIIWPRRKLVGLGLFLVVLNRLSGLVLPYSTGYLVDTVLTDLQFDLLYPLLGGLLAAVIVQSVTAYLLTLLLSVEAQHLIAQLRSQVQRHVLTLPVRFFDSVKTGELVERIMNDVEGVRNLVGTGLVQLVGGVITAVVAFTFLATIDFVMTLLVLVPLGFFTFVSTRAFSKLRPAFRERGELRAVVTGRLTEALGGIRVIKGFHAIEKEGEIFEEGVLGIFRNVKQTLTTTSTVTSLGTFFIGTASVLIMGYGGQQVLNQRWDLILDKIEYRDPVHMVVFLAAVVAITGQFDLRGVGCAWQAEAPGRNHDLFVLCAIHLQIRVDDLGVCGRLQNGHRGGIPQ